ncbi:MAG: RluA family pseudouridine synthase [Oscillospiraceae bacterium]
MRRLPFAGPGTPRLDAFILQQEPGLSPGILHKYLRENKIKLNGKKAPLGTRLNSGDEVCLYLPPKAAAAASLEILYEDEQLLAVNKPAGLLTLDENRPENPNTLLARLTQYAAGAFAVRLCHRLDTGTSGVVLAAKTAAAEQMVRGLIQQHRLEKKYVCVTFGHPAPPAATLAGWLSKNEQKGLVFINRQKSPGAKPVETRYKTLARSGRLALLEIQLVTGRTHQIRAHLASIGTPILGDSKYGNLAANRQLKCRYQCLCASEVSFPAELPAGFEACRGLCIACPKPWFFAQVAEGVLQ